MNVACSACPAKYVIPDDKVKGRKVRIPCKHCGAAIIIDGTVPSGEPTPAVSKVPPGEAAVVSAPPPRRELRGPLATGNASAAGLPNKSTSVPTSGAARAQRTIRQTIIGVAAPANSPALQPPQQVRRPTPIYVRAAAPPELTSTEPQASPQPSGQIRSIRRTMLGGLDTEGSPTADAVAPAAMVPSRPQKRDIKQTIIGGLEAAVGSAPGAGDAPIRPVPRQETPPGIWLAALPDGKTLKVAERDLPRAVKKAYVSMETPLWRSGMSEWLRLDQIPELLSLLNKSATQPQGATNQPQAPLPPKTESPAATPDRPASPTARLPSLEPKRPTTRPSAAPGGQVQPTAPKALPVPFASSATNRQPIVSRVSAPPVPVAKVPSLSPSKAVGSGFSESKPQVSRGPASVSARSSSPTLELVELHDDEEIADVISAHKLDTESEANEMRGLEKLAASKPPSLEPKASVSVTSQGNSSRAVVAAAPKPAQTFNPPRKSVELADGLTTPAVVAGSPSLLNSTTARATLPATSRRKRGLAPAIVLVLLLLAASLVASYVTRQPRSLYGYMRERGWEQSIDKMVRKVSLPVSTKIRKWLQ